MANGIELAKAYVQIVPSATGIKGALENEMTGAGESAGKKGGEASGRSFGEAIKTGLKAAGAVATAAISGASAAIAGFTKGAVENFAEYEQLEGGAKLMWGEAYDFIAEKASSAFSAVQMSTNDYLESANYYATGLKTALGEDNVQAAAELADAIITAQADIVSATGNSAEAVSNAFNGVMRGNYTMLDNLGLGIAGTKAGMQSVIDSVNEWRVASGEAGNLVIDNLADCERALVDYVQMQGMAGYASKEGATTIQGAIASMQGAWSNFLNGMANSDADFYGLMNNVINSVTKVVNLIAPKIAEALPMVVKGLNGLINTLMPQLPEIINQLLPALIEGTTILVRGITRALPRILKIIVEQFPTIVEQFLQIVPQMLKALGGMLPTIGQAGIQIAETLIGYIVENAPTFIPRLAQVIVDVAMKLTDADSLQKMLNVTIILMRSLADGMITAIPILIEALPEIITRACDFFIEGLPQFIEVAGEIILAIGTGMIEALPSLIERIPEIIGGILTAFGTIFGSILDVGGNIIVGLWNGIANKAEWLKNMIRGWVGNVLSFIKNLFGIHSPSTVFQGFGEMLDMGLAEGITGNMRPIEDAMNGIVRATTRNMNAEIMVRNTVGMPGTASTGDMSALIGTVEKLGTKMERMQVVLDSGVMIGTVDVGVGRNTIMAQRGVAFA